MTHKVRHKKSLCGKSMQMVVNIIKLSSFSLSRVTLKTTVGLPASDRNRSVITGTVPAATNVIPVSQFRASSRSQEQESSSKSHSYLVDLSKGEGSSFMIHGISNADDSFSDYINRFHRKNRNDLENADTDGRASDYIRRFHEKNKHDSISASKSFPFILPPSTPKAK